MDYRISDLKNDLAIKLHSTNLDSIHDPNSIIENAVRSVINDVDLEETRRKSELPFVYLDNPLLALPTDLNKKKFIRIMINDNDDFKSVISNTKNNDDKHVDIKTINGFKCMEVEGIEVPEGLELIDFDNTTSLTGSNIDNIKRDPYDYIQGLGSVAFQQVNPGNFSITASALNLNLLGHTDQSSFYMFIKIPPKGNLAEFRIKAGTDLSNCFEITTTRTVYATKFVTGWNLVKLDWRDAVNTGLPDPSDINFIQCSFIDASGLALSGWKVDAITSNLHKESEIEYYSRYAFIDENGVLSPRITSDNDQIIFQESYDLILYKLCELASQHVHDYGYKPGDSEAGYWNGMYKMERRKYVEDQPSSAKRVSTNYYRRRRKRL